ncbi:hypothetical protein LJC17_03645 [Acholeplasma sp. OttesenSCG-928-E16]|nr:hypothetical protein [Acholeplasma sp. OttesenSCG-928-E16]
MYSSYERSKGYQRFKKVFGGLLAKRPTFVYRNKPLSTDVPYIFLCNHGLNGSVSLFVNEIYFPHSHAPIGQQEIFRDFRTRFAYLYNFNHRLRRGLSKFQSFLNATFEATFTKMMYRLSKCIPSYKDHRSIKTFKMTFDCLDQGVSLMIYPENLEMGYNNIFISYVSGFVAIVKNYFKRSNKDIKVCALYYSKQTNQLIFDEPFSVVKMLNDNKQKEEIADFFVKRTNNLYIDFVQPKIKEAERKYKKKYKT